MAMVAMGLSESKDGLGVGSASVTLLWCRTPHRLCSFPISSNPALRDLKMAELLSLCRAEIKMFL